MNVVSDEWWMRQALAEADASAQAGDVPVGCVVVDSNGRELGRAGNRREIDQDATAHAEILALRAACRQQGHWRLEGSTVYVTLEPCAMCAGALINARVARLVYGAADPKAGAVRSVFELGSDRRLNHRFDVVGGLLADQAIHRLQSFFSRLRAEGQK